MDWFESPASERVIEAAAWLPRPSTFLTRYPVLASAAIAVRRGDTDPGPSDVATAVLETADALSDGRLLEAAVRARTARSLARKLGDPHATADARRLLWATRAVESRRSPRGRVRTMLWAAGLAASVAARGYDLMADRPVPRARIRARAPSPRASASGPDRPRPGLHRLEARLLGPFEVAVDGRRLHDWSGMLGRSLLAYLLWRHPQPASRDVVLAEFWPDVPAKSARNRLHVTLHDLRKDLARIVALPVVLHRYSAYVLNPEFDVVTDVAETARLWETAVSAGTDDAATSTALEQMLALHEGSFAEGCTYDEWALGEREFQHLRKLEAMLRLARSYLEGGELAACIDIGRRLLMMDNCHEEAHRILMRAHSRLGQHHLALRQYEQCSRELRVELGMAPDVATLDLVEAIRQRRVV
jgi:DNA-binding SARP family transcriptional activator